MPLIKWMERPDAADFDRAALTLLAAPAIEATFHSAKAAPDSRTSTAAVLCQRPLTEIRGSAVGRRGIRGGQHTRPGGDAGDIAERCRGDVFTWSCGSLSSVRVADVSDRSARAGFQLAP